ncbi:MAG: helix-turn-helix domain-containing protein [Oscillospiraceae bacterium]|nr:helix-turn-helix domain-containing protein [Oscillospiraceae bacterium]
MAIAHTENADRLFRAILTLRDIDECYALFEDLCTLKELGDLAARLEVALLLSQGLNYQQVGRRAGVSSATISRVKRCLDNGSGGYRAALERMKEAGHVY